MKRSKFKPKSQSIAVLVRSLQRSFGNTVQLLSDDSNDMNSLNPERIPTGAINLDYATCGGIPTGRITEIFSELQSAGKSTLCLSIIRAAQQEDAIVALFDTEADFEKRRFLEVGIDPKALIYGQPASMEKTFDIIDKFIDESRVLFPDKKILAVWDSVAATPTEAQVAAKYEAQMMAPQARVLSFGLRKLKVKIAGTMAAVVLTNQARVKFNVRPGYGVPYETVGGKALRFAAALRIELRRAKTIQGANKTNLGILVNAKVEKNKVGIPFRKAELEILFASGLDPVSSTFKFARDRGLLVRDKLHYKIKGKNWEPFFQSQFRELLAKHPELGDEIYDEFDRAMVEPLEIGQAVDGVDED